LPIPHLCLLFVDGDIEDLSGRQAKHDRPTGADRHIRGTHVAQVDARLDTRLHDEENRFGTDRHFIFLETDDFLNGVSHRGEFIQLLDLGNDSRRIELRPAAPFGQPKRDADYKDCRAYRPHARPAHVQSVTPGRSS
jgi:hypothetical protein